MNFFVLRRGQKLGPFPDGAADQMWAGGELRAGDLVCPEGDHNWLPVSRFLESRAQRAALGDQAAAEVSEPSVSTPSASSPSKTTFMRANDAFLDEEILTEEENEVIAGGRFVVYKYCWSLLVSFKQASPPILVRAGEDGFGRAFRYSLLSLFFGWWGIPGPLWAISTMLHNIRGGRDVTLETLTRHVGHARAAAACARHRAATPPGPLMQSLGGMMAALSLALWLGLGWLGWAFAQGELGEPAPGPGAKEFEVANRYLTEAKASAMFGNDPKATEVANEFSKRIREAYLADAAKNKQLSIKPDDVRFSTFCELHADRIIFLVVLPGLNSLPPAVRHRLADEAWQSALEAVTEKKLGFAGLRLAVGVRSAGKYDQVLMGRYVREFAPDNTGLRSRSEGPRSKAKLYPLFVPLDQLESGKDD